MKRSASDAELSENDTPARFNSADSGYSATDAPAIESTKITDLATDLGCVSGSRLEVHRVGTGTADGEPRVGRYCGTWPLQRMSKKSGGRAPSNSH